MLNLCYILTHCSDNALHFSLRSKLGETRKSLCYMLLISDYRLKIPHCAIRITKSSLSNATTAWIFFVLPPALKLLYRRLTSSTRQQPDRRGGSPQSSVGYLVRSMLSPRRLLKLLVRLLCGSAPELVRYRNRMKRRSQTVQQQQEQQQQRL